jgi:hypothetical protein
MLAWVFCGATVPRWSQSGFSIYGRSITELVKMAIYYFSSPSHWSTSSGASVASDNGHGLSSPQHGAYCALRQNSLSYSLHTPI